MQAVFIIFTYWGKCYQIIYMSNRFKLAKEEYKNEDENGRNRLVYAYYGLSIYYAQCLEETFLIVLLVKRINNKEIHSTYTTHELIEMMETSKKTMGNFINEVTQNYKLPEKTIKQLEKTLELRNYLIHNYFKVHISKFSVPNGKLEMIKYFCEFIDNVVQLDDNLNKYYQVYIQRFGITQEQINLALNDLKKL